MKTRLVYLILTVLILFLGYTYYNSMWPIGSTIDTSIPLVPENPLLNITETGEVIGTGGYIQGGKLFLGTGGRIDKVDVMNSINMPFKESIELSNNKNYTGAIEALERAKTLTKHVSQLAIIDFNISINKFAIDRISGVRSYRDLARNTQYPPRIRALAMQRMYLSYILYNDRDILREMRNQLSMSGASRSDVKLAFMKKAYDIYPLPGSALYLMLDELSFVNNKDEALAIYNKYQPKIDEGILIMKESPGEFTEATSAMLGSAQILGNLYRDYAISSKEQVETLYKDLIQFDQEKNLTVNKQYSLVYYANFLAEIGDTVGAEKIINIFLEEDIQSSVKEGLPKSRNLTGLRKMENVTDPRIQAFIKFLRPKIQ